MRFPRANVLGAFLISRGPLLFREPARFGLQRHLCHRAMEYPADPDPQNLAKWSNKSKRTTKPSVTLSKVSCAVKSARCGDCGHRI
jgi:hypothetical protein